MSPVPDVPDSVERYLVDLMTNAGRIGGSMGGTREATNAGGRGAASAAKRMSTVLVERTTTTTQTADLVDRCRRVFDRTIDVEADEGTLRFAVPLGRTGLQQVVVDIVAVAADGPESHVTIRTYAKEGWLSRHPAQRVADQALAAIDARGE